jgi:putative ABC transport system substrate-binding protein
MRRRDFLTLLGAAVAWPRPVIGQSPSKVYRVGLLSAGAPIADNSSQGAALIRGFTQRGYNLGRNLAFERRGAEGHIDRLPRLVDELAASKVDVIVTFGYPPALACKQATTDKFPKHIYHSIVCIGALIAHWELDHWARG